MKKLLCLFLFAFVGLTFACAQPLIQWQACLGGAAGDFVQSIEPTPDGGYVVAGFTLSNDSNVTGNHGNDDFWVVKVDGLGGVEWQECIGGSDLDEPYALIVTADSGYVVAGFSASNDGDASGNHGTDDYWIVKLGSGGGIEWQRQFGGSLIDDAFAIQQTLDGGYVVAGGAESNDGDVTGNHGGYDFWVLRLDSAGNLLWEKSLGGSGDDLANAVQVTPDGGYVVLGTTLSNDGDVTGNHGNWDYWMVKLTDSATVEWEKCFGGSGQDIGYSLQVTADSGYLAAGFTKSANGDVTGMHGTGAQPDMWVVKVDAMGGLMWQRCLGGIHDDKAYSIQNTDDGGSVVAGYAKSNDGDVTGNHLPGMHDAWVVKLTDAGVIQWQSCMGGTDLDWGRSVRPTDDGGYIVAAFTTSFDGDVTGNHGNYDFWVVKLDSTMVGVEDGFVESGWRVWPNPSEGVFSVCGDAALEGGDLRIYDGFGRVVHSGLVDGDCLEVDLSGFGAGIYFAVIVGDDGEEWVGRILVGGE